jgi:tetratricopeptide (TPR) repeat protein
MRGELFRIHLNTFRKVFPHATFWYIYGSDQAFFLATPEPLQLDTERLQAKLDKLPDWFQAEKYQLDTVARVAGFFWMDDLAMDVMIQDETRINTDGVHYFDKQSAAYPFFPKWQLPRFQASALPYFQPADFLLAQGIAEEQVVAGHLAEYAFFNQKSDLSKAYCSMPENGNARYFMSLVFEKELPDPDIFCRSEVIRSYEEILARHPKNYQALNALAEAYAEEGRLPEAFALADKALSLAPGNGMVLDTSGWILFKMGKYPEALVTLREALAALPDHPIVLYHLGAAYLAAGNQEMGEYHLLRALSASQDFPGADEARALLN